jgi:hypothetical protein
MARKLRLDDPSGTNPREYFNNATTLASATDIGVTAATTTNVSIGLTALVPPDPDPAHTCEPLGPWVDWMPPMTWTAGEIESAQGLICEAQLLAPQYDTVAEVQALGFTSLNDGATTGFEHWVHVGRLDDGHEMDLQYTESIVFKVHPDGTRTLVAFMPILSTGSTMDDVAEEWAYLRGWHIYDNLCFNSSLEVVAIADEDGRCPKGSMLVVTPPMLHVWVTDNHCNDPFAGDDENGVLCDGEHQH